MGVVEDRVEKNDPTLTELFIGRAIGNLNVIGYGGDSGSTGFCMPSDGYSFARLGNAIGTNTALEGLNFVGSFDYELGDGDKRVLSGGIKRNSSINKLCFTRCTLSRGVGYELLNSFEDDNRHLIGISMKNCDLGQRGFRALTRALGTQCYVRYINLQSCGINDEFLANLIDAVKGYQRLELLDLSSNNFGTEGCKILSTLIKDANSSLCTLALDRNSIDNNGATILANALVNNTHLEELHLDGNQIAKDGWEAFSRVLCNTTTINDTYLSNHTLQCLEEFESGIMPSELQHVLDLNSSSQNKEEVSIKKILRSHAQLDMKSFFQCDLKILPFAINWFEKTKGVTLNNEAEIDRRLLCTFYQFTRAMPMQVAPVILHSVEDK